MSVECTKRWPLGYTIVSKKGKIISNVGFLKYGSFEFKKTKKMIQRNIWSNKKSTSLSGFYLLRECLERIDYPQTGRGPGAPVRDHAHAAPEGSGCGLAAQATVGGRQGGAMPPVPHGWVTGSPKALRVPTRRPSPVKPPPHCRRRRSRGGGGGQGAHWPPSPNIVRGRALRAAGTSRGCPSWSLEQQCRTPRCPVYALQAGPLCALHRDCVGRHWSLPPAPRFGALRRWRHLRLWVTAV